MAYFLSIPYNSIIQLNYEGWPLKLLGKRQIFTSEITWDSSVQRLKRYTAKEAIIDALCKETNKSFDEIKKERGIIRQITMDLLYRAGGLSGTEIGEMMGVDYSTVSQGRKRLREKL